MNPQILLAVGAALVGLWYIFGRKRAEPGQPDSAPGPTDASTLWTDGPIWETPAEREAREKAEGNGGGGGGGGGSGGGGSGGDGGGPFDTKEPPPGGPPKPGAGFPKPKPTAFQRGKPTLTFRQAETAKRLAGVKASGKNPMAAFVIGPRGRSVKNPAANDAIEKLVRADLPPSTDGAAWEAYSRTHPAAQKAQSVWASVIASPELAGVLFPEWTSLTHGEQAYLVQEAEKGASRETAALDFRVFGKKVTTPGGTIVQFFGKQTAPVLRHTFARGAVTTDESNPNQFTLVHAEVAMADLIRRMEHAWYSEDPAAYRAWMIDNWLFEVYPTMAARVAERAPSVPRLWREVRPEFKGAFRDVVRAAVERRRPPRPEEFQPAFGQLVAASELDGLTGGAGAAAAGAKEKAGAAMEQGKSLADSARGRLGV